jgi:hypothetical protein
MKKFNHKIYSNLDESMSIQVIDQIHSLVLELDDNTITIELSGVINPDGLIECAEKLRQFNN